MVRLGIQRWSPTSNWSPRGKAWTIRSCCPDNVPANQIIRTCCEAHDGVRPSPDWKRARCRPSNTWIHHIHRDTAIPVTDALELAADRSFWCQIATAWWHGRTLRAMNEWNSEWMSAWWWISQSGGNLATWWRMRSNWHGRSTSVFKATGRLAFSHPIAYCWSGVSDMSSSL